MSQEEEHRNPPEDMAELLERIAREWAALRGAALVLPPERLIAAATSCSSPSFRPSRTR